MYTLVKHQRVENDWTAVKAFFFLIVTKVPDVRAPKLQNIQPFPASSQKKTKKKTNQTACMFPVNLAVLNSTFSKEKHVCTF